MRGCAWRSGGGLRDEEREEAADEEEDRQHHSDHEADGRRVLAGVHATAPSPLSSGAKSAAPR